MLRYLKYDLKSNKKFFLSSFMVFIIFLISILSIKIVGSMNRLIEINSTLDLIEIILSILLIIGQVRFIINTFYKDLFTRRGILTFSLPISFREILFSKLIVINLFYLFLTLFTVILMKFTGIKIKTNLFLIFFFIFLVINLLAQIIFLSMAIYKFKNDRIRSIISLILIPLIILQTFLLPTYRNQGIYISSLNIFYLLGLNIIFFFVNEKYMDRNFDLSWGDFMNKFMYVGLIVGLIVSVILLKLYTFENNNMVTIACVVLGTFAGAAVDNQFKNKDKKDDWFCHV